VAYKLYSSLKLGLILSAGPTLVVGHVDRSRSQGNQTGLEAASISCLICLRSLLCTIRLIQRVHLGLQFPLRGECFTKLLFSVYSLSSPSPKVYKHATIFWRLKVNKSPPLTSRTAETYDDLTDRPESAILPLPLGVTADPRLASFHIRLHSASNIFLYPATAAAPSSAPRRPDQSRSRSQPAGLCRPPHNCEVLPPGPGDPLDVCLSFRLLARSMRTPEGGPGRRPGPAKWRQP
jgi:hypothetical protein